MRTLRPSPAKSSASFCRHTFAFACLQRQTTPLRMYPSADLERPVLHFLSCQILSVETQIRTSSADDRSAIAESSSRDTDGPRPTTPSSRRLLVDQRDLPRKYRDQAEPSCSAASEFDYLQVRGPVIHSVEVRAHCSPVHLESGHLPCGATATSHPATIGR